MRHQDQRDRILWICVWQGWHQARPEQDRRHTQDAYPQDREDLQRFIGFMNYLAAYIPHFADKVSPLRELLKKDVPFVWHEDHQHTIRHRDRSKTFAHDTQQDAEECTSTSTTTPGQDTGIRLSARVSTWQTDDNRRCPLKTSQPGKER